jgi:2-oxoglutarate dehydrogenase E1 component
MSDFSSVMNAHPAFMEGLYSQYLQNPESVDTSWQQFFKGFEFGNSANGGASMNGASVNTGNATSGISPKELGVATLIDGFRHRGHLLSTTNPIRPRKNRFAHLDLNDWGLEEGDKSKIFQAGSILGLENATLNDVLEKLRKIYCGNIGFEYSHIESHERRLWLRDRIEKRNLNDDYGLTIEKKTRILEKLNDAVGMEEFLAKKYGPTKRFGLEGGESYIPALDAMINSGVDLGNKEVVIGMAHRGRLNTLANIMGKTYEAIFNEFEGGSMPDQSYGSGDVKYHLGYSSQVKTPAGKEVYLKLLPNPSHLEAVDAVMLGFVRAKLDILYKNNKSEILPIMVHGDASVAGQGIVYEVLQMSNLEGYKVGGTIHFVINNQVGFTTDFEDARTSYYSTSIASTIQSPVFHVNGDDPEAVVFACELAVAYRQEFKADVFIDMVCYRRNGHNESDNPEVTQPQLYNLIKNHPSTRTIYTQKLADRGTIEKTLSEKMAESFDDNLQARLASVKQKPLPYTYQEPEEAWRKLKKKPTDEDFKTSPDTGIDKKTVQTILNHLKTLPEGFKPAVPIDRLLKKNYPETLDKGIIDWALGELMAYGSILLEGKNVRLSGEDVKRGTFSHRNAVVYDTATNVQYNRLTGLNEKQGNFYIYNSLLSEYAVLGFEYGYAMATPNSLVIWEAQFGDFANGAQIIIDQFIAAGESKWLRQNGLVMLLPHGYEGQGPEHSSARLERFLQLCAENNMTIANVTTPANFFHLMRRQLERPFRKPLVVMSPKSLLRHPLCVSNIKDFEKGIAFQEVIDDTYVDAKKVRKVIFCSGKVYYDAFAKQKETNNKEVALVRLEQLYPFPIDAVNSIMKKYANASYHWMQEESRNMGAWSYIACNHGNLGFNFIGRKSTASPATGYNKIHITEQEAIVNEALS